MKNILKITIILFLLFVFQFSKGQEKLLNPTNTFTGLTLPVPEFICPSFDIDASILQFEDDDANGVSPLIFARKFDVNLTQDNSGVWEEVDDLMVWRLNIKSSEAKSIMLILDELNLVDYSSLFIYDKNMNIILGPYTQNYTSSNILPTPLVPSDEITIELVYDMTQTDITPSFKIKSISHDYIGAAGILYGNQEDDAEHDGVLDCHNDIICPIGTNWQLEGRSVARMVVDGKAFCTGALINNTNNDKRSYFLTAWHCMHTGDQPDPNETVFYFNYNSPTCNQGIDGSNYQVVSGAREVALNNATDFSLLDLNARVPTSYQPYFAGWNISGQAPNNTTVIHHPRGTVKKISFDNGSPVVNTIPRQFLGFTLQPTMAWDVTLDNGTTQGGSSGAPLFNEEGRIIGQNSGGEPGCPDDFRDRNNNGELDKHYGRLSQSWNNGNSATDRLSDWLDPNNTNQTDIQGFAPQGFIHDWLMGWNAPTAQNIFAQYKAMDVGAGNQVFYRGTDNKLQSMFWWNNSWNHSWVANWNAPSNQNIVGDIKVGAGNQLFYRGQDAKMHTYYWNNSQFNHDWLGGWNAPSYQDVSFYPGSILVNSTNQVFYRGTDDKIQYYWWNGTNWIHDWLDNWNAPTANNVNGSMAMGTNSQMFYRGVDGKLHSYFIYNNNWMHDWVENWNSSSSHNVSPHPGSIVVKADGTQVYYRGIDNKLQAFYWANGQMNHYWLGGWNAPSYENVAGDIAILPNDQIIYTGVDGRMHTYFWYNNTWNHDWLEASWQTPSQHNPSGPISPGTNGQQIFYRGNDGRCRIYYWENGFMQKTNENYSMNETRLSPTIPKEINGNTIEMKVFPNPFNQSFAISSLNFNPEHVLTINISDITGKIIYSETQNANQSSKITIDLTGINSGIYILNVNSSDGTKAVQKIIKN